MDVVGQLGSEWAQAVLNAPGALKMYVVRVGLGIGITVGLAWILIHRHTAARDGIGTLFRQFIVGALGAIVTVFIPVQWVAYQHAGLQVPVFTVCLVSVAVGPYFLPFYLLRTWRRQRVARSVLYGGVALGLILQIAISGVT